MKKNDQITEFLKNINSSVEDIKNTYFIRLYEKLTSRKTQLRNRKMRETEIDMVGGTGGREGRRKEKEMTVDYMKLNRFTFMKKYE